jgi:periplasmic protein TonB
MPPLKYHSADLRRKYPTYIKISIVLSLFFVIIAFKLAPDNSKSMVLKPTTQDIINVEDIAITTQPKPPDLPKPLIPHIAVTDDIQDIEFADVSIDYNKQFAPTPEREKEKIIEDDDRYFVAVEEPPKPVGGMSSIINKLYYPEPARRTGIEGRVIIELIVTKEGNVINASVLQSLFPSLDEVALNAVKETKFIPGKQRGKPVNVEMKIPIQFRLK